MFSGLMDTHQSIMVRICIILPGILCVIDIYRQAYKILTFTESRLITLIYVALKNW